MPIAHYLAMTCGEMKGKTVFPAHMAWMACHFSPSGKGVSNLPSWLPPGSVLILDDSTPVAEHDAHVVAETLGSCLERLQCTALLLDFQRVGNAKAGELAKYLCQSLPCPVVVSEGYADRLECAVFVPPVPTDETMAARLARWQGREIWLDTTMEGTEICLTAQGAKAASLPPWEQPAEGFADKRLHCHYRISMDGDRAVFTLWRTISDILAQLGEAEKLGVIAAVGLYQEFGSPLPDREEGP